MPMWTLASGHLALCTTSHTFYFVFYASTRPPKFRGAHQPTIIVRRTPTSIVRSTFQIPNCLVTLLNVDTRWQKRLCDGVMVGCMCRTVICHQSSAPRVSGPKTQSIQTRPALPRLAPAPGQAFNR